jgi:hypothetical protein
VQVAVGVDQHEGSMPQVRAMTRVVAMSSDDVENLRSPYVLVVGGRGRP